jgi:hypothetical protein
MSIYISTLRNVKRNIDKVNVTLELQTRYRQTAFVNTDFLLSFMRSLMMATLRSQNLLPSSHAEEYM